MSNTFVTPTIVAREAAMALYNEVVAAGLIPKGISREFAQKVGDTVNVRVPATFSAHTFAGTISVQNATESYVPVTVDKHYDVAFEVTSAERALKLQDLRTQLIGPAAQAIAEQIDSDALSLYKGVAAKVGTAGTTPDGLDDFTAARKKLTDNKAPLGGRVAIWDTASEAKFLQLDAIVGADKSGSTDALREASMGRLFGFDNYVSQLVPTHTAGAGTVAIDLVAGYAIGDTAIHVDGVTTALKVGDALTIGNNDYTVVTAGALATNDQDITIYPALKTAVANDDSVTLTASHKCNLAFHPNFAVMGFASLEVPNGVSGAVESYKGIQVRVLESFVHTNLKSVYSLDVLFGTKVIRPELAVRILG